MSDEFKLQWSISLPPVAQYAKGHMFNLRADTVEEMNALFDEVIASETMEKALSVAELLTGVQTVTSVMNNDSSSPSGDTSNVAPLKTCQHGKRVYKSGHGKKGDWEGWFCPEKNRNQQCDVVWGDK